MKAIVGCEESQVVTLALRQVGIEAYSCDLKPCSGGHPEYHIQDDIRNHLHKDWDLGIFHPDCTYLTCSAEWAYKDGPYHQKVKPGTLIGKERREARVAAIGFVQELWAAPISFKAIENPVGVLSSRWMEPTQFIQPYEYGDDASKITCLWLDNLPPLQPTNMVVPRLAPSKDGRRYLLRWSNQTNSGQNRESPSENRAEIRSKTYQGRANAMADQWGNYLLNQTEAIAS